MLLSRPDLDPDGWSRPARTSNITRMDHAEVGRFWDGNAEAWTELVRAGFDHYRDGLNTPAFF